jgi:hypothetical protein
MWRIPWHRVYLVIAAYIENCFLIGPNGGDEQQPSYLQAFNDEMNAGCRFR